MATPSDAFVFFGATGDLAYKQIFPSLQAMVKAGTLDVPVIGVAKAGWDLDQLKKRAQDSLEEHGGVHRFGQVSVEPCLLSAFDVFLHSVTGERDRRRLLAGPYLFDEIDPGAIR